MPPLFIGHISKKPIFNGTAGDLYRKLSLNLYNVSTYLIILLDIVFLMIVISCFDICFGYCISRYISSLYKNSNFEPVSCQILKLVNTNCVFTFHFLSSLLFDKMFIEKYTVVVKTSISSNFYELSNFPQNYRFLSIYWRNNIHQGKLCSKRKVEDNWKYCYFFYCQ